MLLVLASAAACTDEHCTIEEQPGGTTILRCPGSDDYVLSAPSCSEVDLDVDGDVDQDDCTLQREGEFMRQLCSDPRQWATNERCRITETEYVDVTGRGVDGGSPVLTAVTAVDGTLVVAVSVGADGYQSFLYFERDSEFRPLGPGTTIEELTTRAGHVWLATSDGGPYTAATQWTIWDDVDDDLVTDTTEVHVVHIPAAVSRVVDVDERDGVVTMATETSYANYTVYTDENRDGIFDAGEAWSFAGERVLEVGFDWQGDGTWLRWALFAPMSGGDLQRRYSNGGFGYTDLPPLDPSRPLISVEEGETGGWLALYDDELRAAGGVSFTVVGNADVPRPTLGYVPDFAVEDNLHALVSYDGMPWLWIDFDGDRRVADAELLTRYSPEMSARVPALQNLYSTVRPSFTWVGVGSYYTPTLQYPALVVQRWLPLADIGFVGESCGESVVCADGLQCDQVFNAPPASYCRLGPP